MNPLMLEEALAAAAAVERQLAADGPRLQALGEHLRRSAPTRALTVARGSSDHAAGYLAYLVMARLGCLVASLPMSLVTLHRAPLVARDTLVMAVSQSGQSPDVVDPVRYFREGGATTVALVNDAASPLGQAAEWTLPLHAGREVSVAATKSYITSLVAAARLVAHWQDDAELHAALARIPDQLRAAAEMDWSAALPVLRDAPHCMVVSRGVGFPLALETALKLKETSALQAEAMSGAEIRHGPLALVDEGYPVLVLATRGPARAGLLALASDLRLRGARVLLAAPAGTPGRDLPLPTASLPDLDPIVAALTVYRFAAQLSLARGLDPDHPRHLSKVTRTT